MSDSHASMPGSASAAITLPYCHQAAAAARQLPAVSPSTYSGTTVDRPSNDSDSSNQEGI